MNERSGSSITIYIFLLGFLLLFSFIRSYADPKTDTIYMLNGDRITGEIKNLEYGLLSLKTDGLGTLNIEFTEIKTFYSKSLYDIRTSSGYRYFGSFDTTNIPGMVYINSTNDRILKPLIDIIEINTLKSIFWKRFSGNIDLGYSYTKANTVSQVTLNSSVSYRTQKYYLSTKLKSIISDQQNEDRTRNNDISLNLNRLLPQNWFYGITMSYQQNSELGLKRRLQGGLGVGYDLIHTNLNRLFTTAGAVVNQELSYDTTLITNNVEGVLKVQYRIFRYNTPKVDVTTYLNTYPSFSTPGRLRTEFDIQARIELFKDFYFSLSYYIDYDNKPPSGENANSDWAIISSFGYSF